jgi:hypothetical protein
MTQRQVDLARRLPRGDPEIGIPVRAPTPGHVWVRQEGRWVAVVATQRVNKVVHLTPVAPLPQQPPQAPPPPPLPVPPPPPSQLTHVSVE